MKNEIVKANGFVTLETPELKELEKSKANQIKMTFEPMAKMLSEFENQYNDVITESRKKITKDLTLRAKRIRLDIGRVRIETGKLKDRQKEYIKLEDKAIMGVHNILVWAVKEKEDKLKEIENYFEIQEQKRLGALQAERADKLSFYVEDAHERNLSDMEEDVWEAYFRSKKKDYEDRIAAEKKAEKDRIAKEKSEVKERKRIKAENERLKKEVEDREAREEKERKKREDLENKLRVKEESELKAKQEAEAKLQDDLNKDDAEKVEDLISDFEVIKTKYSFKSAKNKKMYADVSILIDKVIQHIQKIV